MGTIQFDDFTVDTQNFKLFQQSELVPLEPKVFDLLVFLAEHTGKVMSREKIIDAVWEGRFVSDSTVSTAVKELRKALGDSGDAQRFIRTVRGRGFEFIGRLSSSGAPAQVETARAETPPTPTLYVRARSIGTDPTAQILPQSLGSRIRTVLARIPLLRIVAPTKDADTFDDQLWFHKELEVTSLVEIVLVQTETKWRIDASLIRTQDRTQQWSRSFQETLGGLGDDTFLHSLIRQLEPAIVRMMIEDLSAHSEEDPHALLLKATGLLSQKGWRSETFREAETLLEQAVAVDPDLAMAHAQLALIRALGHRLGVLSDDPSVARRAIHAADRALDLESNDSMTLGLAGCALADAGEVARAMPILEKAIEANPDNGHARTALGAAAMLTKDFSRAQTLLEEGIRISPADSRLSVWGTIYAMSLLIQGDIEGAEAALLEAQKRDFKLYLPHVAMIAVAFSRRDREAANAAAKQCLSIRGDITKLEVIALIGQKSGAAAWDIITSLKVSNPNS